MKTLVDILNVNGEASCLTTSAWLRILGGKSESVFCQWLGLYVKHKKKATLGLTGSTVVELAKFNPEAIEFINLHPEIFEIIVRPFSHDVALLRTSEGFRKNLEIGWKVIEKEFRRISLFFLPPEFMLTNEQVSYLRSRGIQAVFINSSRFPEEIRDRIPQGPYQVQGTGGVTLGCIPVVGELTRGYLSALQNYAAGDWNNRIRRIKQPVIFSWRDGESPFLIPDGLSREAFWLASESKEFGRKHLRDLKLDYLESGRLSEATYKSYPVHSFSAWMEGFRMLGFIKRVGRIETEVKSLTQDQLVLWLEVIGSDILSSVEKKSPLVRLKLGPRKAKYQQYVIRRSERGFEGEEYLCFLEQLLQGKGLPPQALQADEAHILRLRKKIEYFSGLKV